ncbi:MAG: hypothetical protein SFV19_19000 [Rhodospirillaceae bacterium]|nr:hypothetical protein [Rhodospirillaceae bacterium]
MTALTSLEPSQLTAMAVAGETVLDSMRVLGRTGDTIVGEVLKGGGDFKVWSHYPNSDVIDPNTHCQFYYHAHPRAQRPGEHGHFHLFIRPEGIPKSIKPVKMGRGNRLRDFDNPMCHLVAVSMNSRSLPIALFATNRWVTNDPWYDAESTIQLMDRFMMDTAHPSWPVNRWISAMVKLFRPDIAALLRERDERLAAYRRRNPTGDFFSNHRIEIISYRTISLKRQVRDIRRAIHRLECN